MIRRALRFALFTVILVAMYVVGVVLAAVYALLGGGS